MRCSLTLPQRSLILRPRDFYTQSLLVVTRILCAETSACPRSGQNNYDRIVFAVAGTSMIELFKQFRKRHRSNDSILALFPLGSCRKASAVHETAHRSLLKKGDDETKNGSKDGSLRVGPASSSEDDSVLIRHPMEPNAIDHPIRCPHPEHCVIQDGQFLKERLPNIKRKGQLPFLRENEAQNLLWKHRTAPSDCQIFPTASAPESSFLTFLP